MLSKTKIKSVYFISFFLFFAGIYLRSLGYFDGYINMWNDEVLWFGKINHATNPFTMLRPAGYVIANKLLFMYENYNEWYIRLFSYVPSVIAPWFAYLAARKLYRSKFTSVFVMFVVVVSPFVVDFAKEFKPYSLELCLHFLVIYLMVRTSESQRIQDYIALFLAIISILFFSYNVVFIFPALFLLVGFQALVDRNKPLLIVTGIFLMIYLGFTAALYIINFSKLQSDHHISYWGKKYDVYYLGQTVFGYFRWLFSKHIEYIQAIIPSWFLGDHRHDISLITQPISLVLYSAGLLTILLRKCWKAALILLLPIITVFVVNSLGKWGYAYFRFNLFLFAYHLFVIGFGFDTLLSIRTPWNRITAIASIALMLVLFPLQSYDSYHEKNSGKLPGLYYEHALNKIYEYHQKHDRLSATLVLRNYHISRPFDFYRKHQLVRRPELRNFIASHVTFTPNANFLLYIENNKDQIKLQNTVFWFIAGKAPTFDAHRSIAKQYGTIFYEEIIAGTQLLLGVCINPNKLPPLQSFVSFRQYYPYMNGIQFRNDHFSISTSGSIFILPNTKATHVVGKVYKYGTTHHDYLQLEVYLNGMQVGTVPVQHSEWVSFSFPIPIGINNNEGRWEIQLKTKGFLRLKDIGIQ